MDVAEASEVCDTVLDEVSDAVIADRAFFETVLMGVVGRGHVLLEDVPGTGKTLTARTVAEALGLSFSRIQFTPDLLPADITGTHVFNERERTFEFNQGPIFANVVLADEINRAPPKTQSALLEAMEEEQVTADGDTRALPDPFLVIATQNSVERDRTYELPVAELDRFMKKLRLGYPDRDNEVEVLDRVVGGHPIDDIEAVATVEDLQQARAVAASVAVSRPVKEYVTELARYTRDHAALGVSPRGSIALLQAAQGRAILDDRDYVVPDDVQAEAPSVLSHRIRAESGGTLGGEPARTLVQRALDTIDPE